MRLPTLTVSGNYNRKGCSAKSGDGLATAPAKLPTLTVADASGGPGLAVTADGSPNLRTVVGGALNPDWCEWLMGWPIGWTDLQPLATAKFQQWLRLHGRRYDDEARDHK